MQKSSLLIILFLIFFLFECESKTFGVQICIQKRKVLLTNNYNINMQKRLYFANLFKKKTAKRKRKVLVKRRRKVLQDVLNFD